MTLAFAGKRNVLGQLRKTRMKPLQKGERPVVVDKIPSEKTSLTPAPIDFCALYSQITAPPPPLSSFYHRTDADASSLTASEAKKRLKDMESMQVVPRVDNINECLSALARSSGGHTALDIIKVMVPKYGIQPNEETERIVAEIAITKARPTEALELLRQRDKLEGRDEIVFGELVIGALRKDFENGLNLFKEYLNKSVKPAPLVVGVAITLCGKRGLTEMAFKLYREAKERRGLLLNRVTQSALLGAASKRKEYYRETVDLFRQLLALKMTPDIEDYTNLVTGAGKVGDLQTALAVWQLCTLQSQPTDQLAVSVFYALASTESTEYKYSKRQYQVELAEKDILGLAKEIWGQLAQLKIKPHARLMGAYLACIALHKDRNEAERIFYNDLPIYGPRHPAAYESILRMYDSLKEYSALYRVLGEASFEKPQFNKMTWRAIARMYAFMGEYSKAVDAVQDMKEAGFQPTFSEMKSVYVKLHNEQENGLKDRLVGLLKIERTFNTNNPYVPWRHRSRKIASFLGEIYGPNAPKLATDKH